MIWIQAIFAAINVAMAKYHASRFGPLKGIKHGVWTIYYGIAAIVATYLFFGREWVTVPVLISLAFQRELFFDLPLNKFRNRSLWYVSNTTGSVLDKYNNWLFRTIRKDRSINVRNVKIMFATYAISWLLLNAFYFLFINVH